ncbi:hypothetical protein MXD61_05185 [Frankia sp. AgPm24]|uniref:hypothetical protein n=1 Tax=Frankia sp. AgPm24 TaxID=631128 RepID=UPI00200E6DEB|nr:hypothetical protein [Frankia sp. AgPm24]MCK9921300.1 hypothetical protein [Frankia sp. AgPm24]
MTSIDHRVVVTDRDPAGYTQPGNEAPTGMVVYFPDGCPPVTPAGWPADVDYDCSHGITVCPECIDSWRLDHFVSDPVEVPAGTPLTIQVSWAAERAHAPTRS